MNLLLDTNAYAELLSRGKWLGAIRNSDRVLLPLPALAELRFGFIKGSRATENETTLRKFLARPSASVLLPDAETTHHYSSLKLQLTRQGTPVPINDLWIASLAIQHSLWLCTSDAHFDHIPQLLRASPDDS